MVERNYFIPSLIILIVFLIASVIIYMKKGKKSIFLGLIPIALIALSYSPLIRKNSKMDIIILIILFVAGILDKSSNLKKR